MEKNKYINRLEKQDIKPTAIRLLVLEAISNKKEIFSLLELEAELGTIDKSTLFRTLTLFQQHMVVHSIDDGSGAIKYSVCSSNCNCSISDTHAHFYCLHCYKTFCLDKVAVPDLKIPDNLVPISINLVIKGFCEECKKFAT
ncbi:Fur family transcriptional regulator [Massilibacteroides vaginae]|uniref:Fur family transcriptional regulator n=1 Tax=Massilibacteroides vaginae TaxID=1673718 RepID=UPI000A1C977A|nr:transcriptional repressor [Massilibacteroides vaginae]